MRRTLLKSKIHRATVTDADLDYVGSITIDPELLEAADVVIHERVEIYNITNGERLATYAIPGTRGAGEICINGAAAHKASPGDLVIIASYAEYGAEELADHQPKVLFVDGDNRITHLGNEVAPGPVAERVETEADLRVPISAILRETGPAEPSDDPTAKADSAEVVIPAGSVVTVALERATSVELPEEETDTD